MRFSNDSHFRWLAATENGGTWMYRTQPVEIAMHGYFNGLLNVLRHDIRLVG
jgi:hypothetical protein